MIDIKKLLDEALTIPADKAGPVELKLRDALSKRKDCKHEDVIVKCCRSDEKSGKIEPKQLAQTYIVGLGNIIDLLKVYDKCKDEYIQQKLDKKVKLERADGKVVELDPLKDLNKISRLPALKQFIENFEKLVASDTSIQTSFKKYAINDHDRECIRLMCWNSRVMVWGTKEFEPSQKFAVQLWQNIETIDSGSAYGDPDEQCPYCTHSKNHWDNHSDGDPDYEQYWYLKIPAGVSCTKRGDLNTSEVVKIYNQLKGLGPDLLICQHDSNDDWCDRDDNPISEYDVDIHDAGETIYLNDDGEPVDPNDEDAEVNEELDFNFGPGKEDFYKDVVELYDKWFTSHEIDTSVPKQPWETDKQYNDRKGKAAKFVKYVGDIQTEEKINHQFDFEHDVWTHPITLKAEHFKDGILAVQLPQVMNCWLKIEGAEIASFAGFPRDLIGNGALKELKFESCKLKSAESWSPSEDTKNGLRLTFSKCTFEDSFKLGDALGGASLQKLVVDRGTAGEDSKATKDFKFLGGTSKLKSITELSIGNAKMIESFEGLSESLEEQKIQTIFIQDIGWYGDGVQINSFKGLPAEVENLTITPLRTTEEAVKNLNLSFPTVSAKLQISIKNTEQEILVPMFRTIWTKAQDTCKLEYEESGKHIFDTLNIEPISKALKDDKVPSRFSGLPRKKFASQRINLDLSPRNMYEERSFLSSDVGFGDSGVFDPQKIPLFQNESKLFDLRHGSYYLNDRSYAMVKDGRIVCFSPNMDIIEGPFTKEKSGSRRWWDTICLDDGEHGPDFSLDEALKVFLATRKTDFPEVETLVLMDGFTGKNISNIDEPDLSLRLSRGGCPNLVEVSRCKLAALQDERGKTLHWDDKKTFESQTVYKDCVFSEGSKLEAKAVYNCTITQPEKDKEWISGHGGVAAIQISAKEGVFSSKLSSKSLGVRVESPVVEGCDIESGGRYIELVDTKKLASTKLVAKSGVRLRITEDFSMARDCWLESTGGEEVEVNTYAGKTKIDPARSDEIASAIASCLKGQQLKSLDLYHLSITSLKFLEELPSELKIQQVGLNVDELKDFSFKLKNPGQVDSLGYPYHSTPHLKDISKDATLDGFDASVLLSLGYYLHGKNNGWPSRVVEQFDKYFTQYPKGPYHLYQAMGVDPNYIDKNGQFAAPKTLDERLFGRPTTTEEDNWLRVMKLFD